MASKLENYDYWSTSDDLEFIVDKQGTYIIKIVNGKIESDEKKVKCFSEYIKDKLLCHFDGINNTGQGDSKHSNTTTTWKDLCNNYTATLINSPTWKENHLSFDGVDDWVNIGQIKTKNMTTLETTISVDEIQTGERCIFDNFESGGMGIILQDGKPRTSFFITGLGYKYATKEMVVTENKLYTITSTYDGENIRLYVDGELCAQTACAGVVGEPVNDTVMALGTNPYGNSAPTTVKFNAYSARIYEKVLTEDEIRNNYEVDKLRFEM